MTARTFLDTNILVYGDDADADGKRRRATELIEDAFLSRKGVVSTQVLSEYFYATTRKLKTNVEIARAKIEMFRRLEVVVIQPGDVLAAIDLVRLYSVSYWDALILRAASEAGCRLVFSEDMNHGQIYAGVQVINLFRE